MRSLLQIALESTKVILNGQPTEDVTAVDQDQRVVVMKGPLSQQYTDALNAVYAKEPNTNADGQQENVGIESQQIDATLARRLSNTTNALKTEVVPPTSTFQTVYGVGRDELTENTIVDITKDLADGADRGDDAYSDYIVIIDATAPGANGSGATAPETRVKSIGELEAAIECLVAAHGGKVYHSLEEYKNSLEAL